MTAPAAPAPVVLPALGLARRAWFVLGCFLLHPRTPALVARVVMVLPRALVYAVLVLAAPYAIRGFFVVLVELDEWYATAVRLAGDVLAVVS